MQHNAANGEPGTNVRAVGAPPVQPVIAKWVHRTYKHECVHQNKQKKGVVSTNEKARRSIGRSEEEKSA